MMVLVFIVCNFLRSIGNVTTILLVALLLSSESRAGIKVNITRGNTENISIAFSNILHENENNVELGDEISKIIKADLIRSGLFKINKDIQLSLNEDKTPNSDNWHAINSTSLVITNIKYDKVGKVTANYKLWDTTTEKKLLEESFEGNKKHLRRISHMIADAIYHRMTGEKGYFDSRIVYIAEHKNKKRIAIIDQDGANRKFLTDSNNLVLTPHFSPESMRIVYMSYVDDLPTIYMRNIKSNAEELIGNFSGIKSSPVFTPDGKEVSMARSINGSTDIYNIDLATRKTTKLTGRSAINTSPSYSPDQKHIVFNSDRGGSPQLYVMNTNGRKQHQISKQRGRYNSPSWSPRGDWIAFTKVMEGNFYIGVMKPDGSGERLLTTSYLVESPTWSPNGRIIAFTKHIKHKDGKTEKKLYSIDLTGENERIVHTNTEASDPSWSPLLQQDRSILRT